MAFTQSEKNTFLTRATQIIEENLSDERFGVNELAREMDMSRSNLHRKLKAVSGLSISSYIRQVRLGRAMELLKQSSSTISEIAFEVGFHSVTYFNKSFHDFYGHAPGKVRKGEIVNDGLERLQSVRKRTGFPGKRVSLRLLISLIAIIIAALILIISIKPFRTKDALDRYFTDLPSPDKSIAVLPFMNDSPDQEGMYFINGTMEAILNNLCKIEDLRVVSRTSVEQYRDNPRPITVIAEEMQVSYILEGSGMRHEDQLFLSVQLIDARSDKHIWSESYQKGMDGITELFSRVAQTIAAEINVHISPEEKSLIERIPTTSREAYELYLRAVDGWYWSGGSDKREISLHLLRQAIEIDPRFADAYAEIGWIYIGWYYGNPNEYASYLDSALLYANKAISLDSGVERAHVVKGSYFRKVGDYTSALESFRNALRINPNDHDAYFQMGWGYSRQNDYVPAIENFYKATLLDRGERSIAALGGLGFQFLSAGFPEKSIELLKEKVAIDGDSLLFYSQIPGAERNAGNLLSALEAAQKAFAIDRNNLSALKHLTRVHLQLGNTDKALEYCHLCINRMEALDNFDPNIMQTIIYILRQSGESQRADKYLEAYIEYTQTSEENPLTYLERNAIISAFLGEYEKALKYLAQIARQEKLYGWVTYYRYEPAFSEISTDPEFLRIISEIERKFEAQRERDRQLLEEKGLL